MSSFLAFFGSRSLAGVIATVDSLEIVSVLAGVIATVDSLEIVAFLAGVIATVISFDIVSDFFGGKD
ncbi:MAG: hypothetical protein PHO32_02915 [Candidatus Cloacimonetes bacterium]|nr:hypothetical protein [Candidatus Cloacimonadota bacterium]